MFNLVTEAPYLESTNVCSLLHMLFLPDYFVFKIYLCRCMYSEVLKFCLILDFKNLGFKILVLKICLILGWISEYMAMKYRVNLIII